MRKAAWLCTLGAAAWLASVQCGIDVAELVRGLPSGMARLGLFLQPTLAQLPEMLWQAAVTVLLALLATPLAVAIALVVAVGAASNLSPPWIRIPLRLMLSLERALPEIVVVFICVAAYGLGPFPAVIALVAGSVGMLGKLFADCMEEVDQHLVDALAATGARPSQVVRYAVLPQVLPSLISLSIFRFEINIRAATILGGIAGQGIGYELYRAISLLEFERASTAILVVVLLIVCVEQVSHRGRRAVLAEGRLT